MRENFIDIMYFDLINIFYKNILWNLCRENNGEMYALWYPVKWIYGLSNNLSFLSHPMYSPYFKTSKMYNVFALGLVLLNILMICIMT